MPLNILVATTDTKLSLTFTSSLCVREEKEEEWGRGEGVGKSLLNDHHCSIDIYLKTYQLKLLSLFYIYNIIVGKSR